MIVFLVPSSCIFCSFAQVSCFIFVSVHHTTFLPRQIIMGRYLVRSVCAGRWCTPSARIPGQGTGTQHSDQEPGPQGPSAQREHRLLSLVLWNQDPSGFLAFLTSCQFSNSVTVGGISSPESRTGCFSTTVWFVYLFILLNYSFLFINVTYHMNKVKPLFLSSIIDLPHN